jgi:uncharacterized protein (DUF1810 family)
VVAGGLKRFHLAQDSSDVGFMSALTELQTTGKRGHWIWYIFPQISGLGTSSQSLQYGIQGTAEAMEYLRDPVLGSRLLAATNVVAQRLQSGMPLQRLMGSTVDVLKLVSSLTLFEAVSRTMASEDPGAIGTQFSAVAHQVLAASEAQGYARCVRTLHFIGPE